MPVLYRLFTGTTLNNVTVTDLIGRIQELAGERKLILSSIGAMKRATTLVSQLFFEIQFAKDPVVTGELAL